nr:NTP transferase domain-containing protein [Acidobacteriota bacterium]
MKTLVVIQARTGSTRLPGKILLPLAGAPLLARMVERVRAATVPFALAVATTWEAADEPVRELCREIGVDCVSGHPTDLLDRHRQAARAAAADVVVKIPSDCPLIDPQVIDRVLGFYFRQQGSYDFVSNLHPATYPDGNDVEVVTAPVLETAWREAARPFEREHTTPFIWERPERFRLGNVTWESGKDLSMSHRFTIDYPEDHAFAAAVYDALWRPERPVFGLPEILELLTARPDIHALN